MAGEVRGEGSESHQHRSKKRALSLDLQGEDRAREQELISETEGEMRTREKTANLKPTFAATVRDGGIFSTDQNAGRKEQTKEMAARWAAQNRTEDDEGEKEPSHDLCPVLNFSKSTVLEMSEPWWGSLIVKVLGRRVSYQFLLHRLQGLWRPTGELRLTTLGADYFLVQLGNWKDRDLVINGGPWAVYGHHLAVREWSPSFVPHEATINRAVVWVRVPGLPLEYYSPNSLDQIGNSLGKMVRTDRETAERRRCSYARFCVEIDLDRSLIAHFQLNGTVFNVVYEGLQLVCFDCGRVGHRRDGCPSRFPTPLVAPQMGAGEGAIHLSKDAGQHNDGGTRKPRLGEGEEGDASKEEARAESGSEHHGAWMTVTHRRRRRGSSQLGGGEGEARRTDHSGGGGGGAGGGDRRIAGESKGKGVALAPSPEPQLFWESRQQGLGPGSQWGLDTKGPKPRSNIPSISASKPSQGPASGARPKSGGQTHSIRPSPHNSLRKIKGWARGGPPATATGGPWTAAEFDGGFHAVDIRSPPRSANRFSGGRKAEHDSSTGKAEEAEATGAATHRGGHGQPSQGEGQIQKVDRVGGAKVGDRGPPPQQRPSDNKAAAASDSLQGGGGDGIADTNVEG